MVAHAKSLVPAGLAPVNGLPELGRFDFVLQTGRRALAPPAGAMHEAILGSAASLRAINTLRLPWHPEAAMAGSRRPRRTAGHFYLPPPGPTLIITGLPSTQHPQRRIGSTSMICTTRRTLPSAPGVSRAPLPLRNDPAPAVPPTLSTAPT